MNDGVKKDFWMKGDVNRINWLKGAYFRCVYFATTCYQPTNENNIVVSQLQQNNTIKD